jgi:hypothetical protein
VRYYLIAYFDASAWTINDTPNTGCAIVGAVVSLSIKCLSNEYQFFKFKLLIITLLGSILNLFLSDEFF